jgi:hypothetical protein
MNEAQKIIFNNFIEIPPRYLSETYHEFTAISVMLEVIKDWKNG